MASEASKPVVHLELHTDDLQRACAFYARICGWRPEHVDVGDRSYLAMEMDGPLGGGIVECRTRRPLWLPYVEVADISTSTQEALRQGASLLLEPKEGPVGWRSVVAAPAGAQIAFWQPKEPHR